MYSIRISGIDETRIKLNRLTDSMKSEISANILDVANFWSKNSVKDAPVNYGKLKQGISVLDESKGLDIKYSVVSASEYSAYMEFGTKSKFVANTNVDSSEFRSNGTGSKGGFYDAILDWVKAKKIGIKIGKSGKVSRAKKEINAQKNIAYAIYLSIIKNGVKPHPFFFKYYKPSEKLLTSRITKIVNSQKL